MAIHTCKFANGVCTICGQPPTYLHNQLASLSLQQMQSGQLGQQQEKVKEEKLEFKSGTVSTKQPRLSLIPHAGLVNAAKRFELGIERHGSKAWNGLTGSQGALCDEEWLIERCSHAIEHCYRLIDFLTHKTSSLEEAEGDAGAVAWAGLVLGEALSRRG